jgi:hypothetical protein
MAEGHGWDRCLPHCSQEAERERESQKLGVCNPVILAVILATQEAEIRKIAVRSQPGHIVHGTLSQKNPSQKRAGGVAQGVGLEFKPQYQKKKFQSKLCSSCQLV